jgi:hypothetical protein
MNKRNNKINCTLQQQQQQKKNLLFFLLFSYSTITTTPSPSSHLLFSYLKMLQNQNE